MATAMADSVVETKIQTLTKKLSNKHSSWKSHQLKSNDMLYCLLEDCVEFYRFLKSDERYETMFRNLSGVKIKANTIRRYSKKLCEVFESRTKRNHSKTYYR